VPWVSSTRDINNNNLKSKTNFDHLIFKFKIPWVSLNHGTCSIKGEFVGFFIYASYPYPGGLARMLDLHSNRD